MGRTTETELMGRRKAFIACLATLLAAAVVPGAVQSAAESRTSMAALQNGVLAQLNGVRAAKGLRSLTISPALSAAARQHTSEMLADGYFEHKSFNGTDFSQRIVRFYAPSSSRRWSVGENLLWSSPDIRAKKALELWMASPGHRANILAPGWREIGIAAVHADSSVGVYGGGAVTVITTDFGTR
jgi:uncharacterized protein YkwD